MIDLPDDLDVAALEAIAVDVATSAGALIVDDRPDRLGVASTKSTATDIVTVMDQRSQDHLVTRLGVLRPDDGVLGEEEGGATGTSGVTWVVDPIDGTVNYLYDLPAYAVSVAAVVGDPRRPGAWRPVAGAVVNPVSGECYRAAMGQGARRVTPDGTTRTLSARPAPPSLALALVATGFGYAAQTRRWQAQVLLDLLPRVRDIRRIGSAALDLCRLAAGEVDLYYETGLNPWDVAAGWLVATEAGLVIGGLDEPPSSDLSWGAPVELADEFGSLIRGLTARHNPGLS